MKIIVPNYVNADDANRLYGESYGVNWEYEDSKKSTTAERIMELHDETMTALTAPAAEQGLNLPDTLEQFFAEQRTAPSLPMESLLDDTQPDARGVEGKWLRMDSCPVGEKVLFWNQETEDMFFGHKPEDAPHDEAVVTEFPHTAAWADAWMPRPPEPEGETEDPDATPNPVRAEKPEGKGDDPGRMAIRLLVAAGHVTEAKANEALCIAHGFEPGPLAPAAPGAAVGVDDTKRLDFMQSHRVGLVPEYEGPWEAEVFGEEEEAPARYSGNTPREALDKAMTAALAGKEGAK